MRGLGIFILLPMLFIILGAQANSEKNEPKLAIPVEATVISDSFTNKEMTEASAKLAPTQNSEVIISAIAIDNSFVEQNSPKSRNQIFSVRLTPPEIPDNGCEDYFILYPNETILLEAEAAHSDGPDSMILVAAGAKELSVTKVGSDIIITNNKSYKIEFDFHVDRDTIVLDVFQSPI